jgi:hypothetical protein
MNTPMRSLMQPAAFEAAKKSLHVVSDLLNDGQRKAVLWRYYEILLQMLIEYEDAADRRMRRLHPGNN